MRFTTSLKKNEDFRNIYSKKSSKADKLFVLYSYHREDENECNRLGISVSKKVGNSVIRHRVKRLIKECYRSFEVDVVSRTDIVVVARQPSKDATYRDIRNSLIRLFKKKNLIKN